MLTITKDKDTKRVTKGAYETYYKRLNYKIVDKKKSDAKNIKDVTPLEPTSNDKTNTNKDNNK